MILADGKIELPPVFGTEKGIEGLNEMREEIRQRLHGILGGLPLAVLLKVVIDYTHMNDGYEVQHLT